MIDRDCLKAGGEAVGVPVDADLAERLDTYARLLAEWNEKMNLTAITEPGAMVVKHFVDSLAAAPLLPAGSLRLIDVGTGAGFPSVPMKLIRRDLQLTLLDSLEKRLGFLRHLCAKLGIDAATIHLRAEEAGRSPAHREKYDVATSRAVASLGALAEYCLPLVKPGGVMLALKGSGGEEEAEAAQKAIGLCGGRLVQVLRYQLPGGDGRTLVVIEKISQTPTKYPRPSAQISKRPL